MKLAIVLTMLSGLIACGPTWTCKESRERGTDVPTVENGPSVGVLCGTVKDSVSGEPIVGASVYLVGTDLGAYTRPAGSYRNNRIVVGEYTVRVSHVEYYTREYVDVRVTAGDTTRLSCDMTMKPFDMSGITVNSGHPALWWETLRPRGKISGVVYDAGTGRPIRRAKVEISGTDCWTATNLYGRFGFQEVRSGSYTLRVSHKRYCTLELDLKVESGQRVAENFELRSKPGCDSP